MEMNHPLENMLVLRDEKIREAQLRENGDESRIVKHHGSENAALNVSVVGKRARDQVILRCGNGYDMRGAAATFRYVHAAPPSDPIGHW
jgi:hypothetical protein